MAARVRNRHTQHNQDNQLVTRLANLTIAGIVVYVLLVVVAQLLPPHYSPIHDAESNLAVGPYGYVMTIAFVVRGALSLSLLVALARGLTRTARSRAGMIALGIWGVGALLLAAFPTDVSGGIHTAHGGIHLVVALFAFLGGAIGALLLSRRFKATSWPSTWKTAIRLLSYLSLIAMIVFFMLTNQPQVFGLFERLYLASVLLWMLVVARRLSLSTTLQSEPKTPSVS